MKAELKTKWVEALRSGEYKQGQNSLRSIDNNYCCLGVLCDLIDPKAWNPDEHNPSVFVWRKYATALLPTEIRSEHNLGYYTTTLMGMNDGDATGTSRSFSEIADYIEKNIPAE